MINEKPQTAPSRWALLTPGSENGASIEMLKDFAGRGQECLAALDGSADARLESIRTTRYRLAGNARSSAREVEARGAGEFGCGLRVDGRHGAGFAVGEGAFSWSDVLAVAAERASGIARSAPVLPSSIEDENVGQSTCPALTEMRTPTRRWFAGVHEVLRATSHKSLVLGELGLQCTIGWRAVLHSRGICLLRDVHDLRLSAMGAVRTPWGEWWPVSVSEGSTHDWLGMGDALLGSFSGLGGLLRFSGRGRVRDYTGSVVLDPQVAGFLVHEAIGHLSEADRLPQDVRNQIVTSGRVRIGPDNLNVTDHAKNPLARGAIPFDDEGVRCIDAPLVRGGYWKGLLHSRETALAESTASTGSARTTSYRHAPLCRMRTTEIHSGHAARKDILLDSGDALYLGCPQEGEVPGGKVQIRAWAWRIRDGEVRDCQGPVTLLGEAPTVLREIDAIGTDQSVIDGHPGCGRKGQPGLLPVSMIAPTLRLRNVQVRFE